MAPTRAASPRPRTRTDARRSWASSIPHFVVKPGNIRLDGDLGGGAVILDEKADVTESSYAAQLRHLVDVLPDGPSPLRAADAVRTMALVDDVYRAAGLQPR